MNVRRRLLSDAELQAQLPGGWTGTTARISREFQFNSYQAGVDFALQVARLAEAADHHPDLLIGYKKVTVTFWTHDAGGVTALDLAGASGVNAL